MRPTPRSSRASRSSAHFPADSHPPIIYPVAADHDREAGGERLSRVPALAGREVDLREVRLLVPDQADVVSFRSDACDRARRLRSLSTALAAREGAQASCQGRADACSISPPTNGPRSSCRCASRSSPPWWRCRSASRSAWLLARKNFWGKALVDGIVHLPLVLPPVVTGYLLLISFGRRGPIGAFLDQHFGIVFSFRWTGAALACGVMGFPLLVRADPPVDRGDRPQARRRRRDARRQPRCWVFATVTLPLALPGMIAGMVLCFAKALGEFGATITFVSNIPGETQTISAAIYTYTQVPGGDAAAGRLVLVAIVAVARRAGRVRMARAPRRHALPRGVSDARRRRRKAPGRFHARRASFEAAEGVTALFGPSGAGKTTIVNMIAGLIAPDRGRIALDDTVLFDSRRAHRRAAAPPPHRLRVPGRPAVPASHGAPQSRLRPPHERPCARRRRDGRASSSCSTSATCSIAGPASSRAASASASPSAARC